MLPSSRTGKDPSHRICGDVRSSGEQLSSKPAICFQSLASQQKKQYVYIYTDIYIYINITHQSVTLPNRKHNWFQVDCTCGPKGWTVRDLDLSWQPEKGTGKNDTNDHSILKETKNVRIS